MTLAALADPNSMRARLGQGEAVMELAALFQLNCHRSKHQGIVVRWVNRRRR